MLWPTDKLPSHKPKNPQRTPWKRAARDADLLAEARRTMAISLITSLADEARGFRDLMLRARVQARSADVLWEVDHENARALFRRAWNSAEAADDDNARRSKEQRRNQATARGSTARRQQPSVRREVLRLDARQLSEVGVLLVKTDRDRTAQVLDMALAEARRLDQRYPDRVRTLVAIVTQFRKLIARGLGK